MTVGVDLIWQKLGAALNSPAPERVLLFADERLAVDALLEDVLIERPYLEGPLSVRHLMYGDVGVLPESLSAQALCVATEGVLWIDHYRGVGESAERARLDTLRVLEAVCLVDAMPAFKLVVVLPGIWKGLVPAIVPGFYRQCGVILELPAPVLSTAQKRDRDRQSAADMAASHGLTVGQLAGRAKAPVKFIDPSDATRQWSGRGTAPAWYRAYVALHGGDEGLRVSCAANKSMSAD